MTVTLTEVAGRLYGLPPGEFVAARDAEARALRTSDRELAEQVRTLRKPSTAAWAVNVLTRERADLLDEVLRLGASLRQAQARLQGDELRSLTRQRRQLVAAVTAEARSLASAAGVRLSEPVTRQVEETLAAALADEAAAEAVRSGSLTDALESTGLGSLSAGDVTGAPAPAGRRLSAVPAAPTERSAGRDRAAAARRAAQERLERASVLLSDADARLEKAASRKSERQTHLLRLEAELDEVRRRAAELEHAVEQATDDLDEAVEAHESALALRDEAKQVAAAAAQEVARTS